MAMLTLLTFAVDLPIWAQTMTWTFLKWIPMLPPPLVLSGRGLCCRERSHLRHRAKIRSLPHVQSTQPRDQQHATSPEDFADDDEDNVLEVIIQDSMYAPRHLLLILSSNSQPESKQVLSRPWAVGDAQHFRPGAIVHAVSGIL